MRRRHFIKSTIAGSVAMGAFPYHLYAGSRKKYAHDRTILGKTGIEVSRMAMGTGTHGFGGSSNQTRMLGIKGLSDLLRAAYDEGITFFETADQYGAHQHIKEALKRLPREKIVILTKSNSRTARGIKADLDRFRKELGTDYFDIVLLHAITDPEWTTNMHSAMEALSEAKEEGTIRAHGISCHSLPALKLAAQESWVDVHLVRYNQGGFRMDGSVPEITRILQSIKQQNKGLIQMKLLGGGNLTHQPDECLQYSLAQPFLNCFTLGVESWEQFKDIQRRIPESSVRG